MKYIQGAIKKQGRKWGAVLLLGDRGSGIFIGRIGKGSEYDRSGGWVCCAKA